MILALDVGNTNIVLGCIDKNNIYFKGRIATDKNKTETEYAIIFKNILDIHNIDKNQISGVIMSSVVPPINRVLSEAVKAVLKIEPKIVNVKSNTGLKINMDNKYQLGNDLIVDAVAALSMFKPPIIIIDMGTATTVSVIDSNGIYIGGLIIPGIKISQEALSSQTSQLPSISFEPPSSIIGKNTIDCMKSGLIYGNAAMLDGIIDRIESELNDKATVIATGGLSKCVVDFCKHNIIYDDDLLLKGLFVLYEKDI